MSDDLTAGEHAKLKAAAAQALKAHILRLGHAMARAVPGLLGSNSTAD